MMKLIFLLSIFFQCCRMTNQKESYESLRHDMVDKQIIARGVTDQETLRAMRTVPRHLFVPAEITKYAYDDRPLSIGSGQTISQPFIVAYMTECSQPSKDKKALEIGTGSGYQAAILSEVVDSVYTIEIVPKLAAESAARLKNLGYNNVIVMLGDGYKGWPEHAPFDIILVTAAADHIPQPLIDQLAEGGRLVMPVGKPLEVQELILVEKKRGGRTVETRLTSVRFVPLTRDKN